MSGVTYDAGALLAGEQGQRRLWALHRRTLERGQLPNVPAGVLAQTWRGGPQAGLTRLLAGCQVQDLGESEARLSGSLLAKAGLSDVADASVVAAAVTRRDVVFTSDRSALTALARSSGHHISIVDI